MITIFNIYKHLSKLIKLILKIVISIKIMVRASLCVCKMRFQTLSFIGIWVLLLVTVVACVLFYVKMGRFKIVGFLVKY
jgi:hypothetical protein